MFSKTLLFVPTFFTLLVAATTTTITEHPPNPSPVDSGDCNSIGYHPVCCTAVLNESLAPAPSILIGLLSVVVTAGTQLLGVGCLPIVGSTCAGNVVCCESNAVGGLVNVGCVNIII